MKKLILFVTILLLCNCNRKVTFENNKIDFTKNLTMTFEIKYKNSNLIGESKVECKNNNIVSITTLKKSNYNNFEEAKKQKEWNESVFRNEICEINDFTQLICYNYSEDNNKNETCNEYYNRVINTSTDENKPIVNIEYK